MPELNTVTAPPAHIHSARNLFGLGHQLYIDGARREAYWEKPGQDRQLPWDYEQAEVIRKAFARSHGALIHVISNGDPVSPEARQLSSVIPSSAFEHVTPTLASEWLEQNTHNRPRQTRLVNRYAQLMTEGRWLVTSDAVAFDTGGRLVNGQHRLGAIVKSGKAQTMLVCRGLAPEVFQVLDYGKKRSGGDALAIEGYRNASTMAAVCKLVHNWERGALNAVTRSQVENDEIVRIAGEYPGIESRVSEALRFVEDFSGLVPASYMCFIYWAWCRHGNEADGSISKLAYRFIEQVATGIGFTSKRDPSYLLRQLLLDDAMSRRQGLTRLSMQARMAAIIQAANAFMKSEELVKLHIKTDPFPEPICGLDLNS